uniref:Uncharacterized protein n=1 Tax=Anopheles farauti TaxID=69004 RepID=A0A182QBB2_9DIPT
MACESFVVERVPFARHDQFALLVTLLSLDRGGSFLQPLQLQFLPTVPIPFQIVSGGERFLLLLIICTTAFTPPPAISSRVLSKSPISMPHSHSISRPSLLIVFTSSVFSSKKQPTIASRCPPSTNGRNVRNQVTFCSRTVLSRDPIASTREFGAQSRNTVSSSPTSNARCTTNEPYDPDASPGVTNTNTAVPTQAAKKRPSGLNRRYDTSPRNLYRWIVVCEIMLIICASPISFTTTSRHPFGERSIAVHEHACSYPPRPQPRCAKSFGEGARDVSIGDANLLRVQVDGDDQTVQTQHFGENEDQDHTDEQSRLLGSTTDTGVTDDTDGETGCQTRETDGQTSTEMDEAPGG